MESKVETEVNVGIIKELGELPPGAVISEEGLAKIFNRHQVSVKRAIQRGELPPSVKLFGEQVWTVKVLLEHLTTRLQSAQKENLQFQRKISQLAP